MLAPTGKSNSKDSHNPNAEESTEINVAKTAILSGVLEMGRAARAGITKNAGANKAPINLNAEATKNPMATKKIN